jgi:hypothetical protein
MTVPKGHRDEEDDRADGHTDDYKAGEADTKYQLYPTPPQTPPSEDIPTAFFAGIPRPDQPLDRRPNRSVRRQTKLRPWESVFHAATKFRAMSDGQPLSKADKRRKLTQVSDLDDDDDDDVEDVDKDEDEDI